MMPGARGDKERRRHLAPDAHPLVSGFSCPKCQSATVRLATVAERFFYLRCEVCEHVWSHPERRQMASHRPPRE
jgi:transcription elongation factor Elf1